MAWMDLGNSAPSRDVRRLLREYQARAEGRDSPLHFGVVNTDNRIYPDSTAANNLPCDINESVVVLDIVDYDASGTCVGDYL